MYIYKRVQFNCYICMILLQDKSQNQCNVKPISFLVQVTVLLLTCISTESYCGNSYIRVLNHLTHGPDPTPSAMSFSATGLPTFVH